MTEEEEEGDLVVVVVVDWWWTKATCRVQVAGWVFAAGASTCLLLSSVVLRKGAWNNLVHLVQQLVCKVSSVVTGISVSNLKAMRLSTIQLTLQT